MCGDQKHFSDLIRERYSVRKYSPKMVEEIKLNFIIDAARLAPSARNTQPTRLIILRNGDSIAKIRKITPMAFDAPVVIIVCADMDAACPRAFVDGADFSENDTAIATDHMILQAQELGLGTCWVGYFDPEIVKKEFDIPGNWKVYSLLPLGYPADDCVPGPMHSIRHSKDDFVKYM